MRRFFTFTLCLLVLALCFSCGQNPHKSQGAMQVWMARNGKLKVLSTIAMIDDLVKQVGGEHVDTIALIKGELNPHSYQLVKGDNEKLAFADLIFYNGLGLEHGPSLQQYLHDESKAVGLGNRLLKQSSGLILSVDDQLDPHIWMDVSLWAKTTSLIAQELSQKDPAHADFYRANAEKLMEEMTKLHTSIYQEMQRIPEQQRYLVTSHDAFNYFTRAYLAEEQELNDNNWQRRFAAPEGLAPESQLSTRHIQLIIDFLVQHKIHVLFPESNVSKDSIRKIVNAGREKNLQLQIATENLYADAMGEPGSDGDTYMKMLQHNAHVIASYLKVNHP
jgi:manganese/zinc/iron transport system substrate-binding protein